MTSTQEPEQKVPVPAPSRWTLVWRSNVSLMLTMVLGFAISAPVLQSRVRCYYERNYFVGETPSDDTQLLAWARSRPGVDSFIVERQGSTLRIRSDYRGFTQHPPQKAVEIQLRGLGYELKGLSGAAFGVRSGLRELLTDPLALATMLVGTQLAFGVVGLRNLRTRAKTERQLPPKPGRHRRALVVGIVAGSVLFGLGFVYSMVLPSLLGYSPPSPWDSAHSMSTATKIVFLFFGALGAPIAEELYFRGYLFGMFKRAGLVWFGILVTAVLFAAVHFPDIYNVPVILLFGVALGWIYHRWESLLAPIAAHAVNNAVAIGIMIGT